MAETTDRPADAAAREAPAEDAGGAAPTPEAAPAPAGDAAPADAAPRPYGAVSVVAVLGFALAALYAVVMTGAALIALFTHTPVLFPLAWLLVPLAAALLCAAAWAQIRGSEGALSGLRLAAWGIGLSLLVGLLYTAYYSATYFAVTQQARGFADQFFKDLGNTGDAYHLEKAFVRKLPPPRPAMDDNKLRGRLELDFRPTGKGDSLSEFRQDYVVRLIQQGGDQSHWEYLGVQDWGYEQDGYHVKLTYRVFTPFAAQDVLVTVVGSEGRDYAGREWRLLGCQASPEGAARSDAGRRMEEMHGSARSFAEKWVQKEFGKKTEEAYADTLPPAKRADLADALKQVVAARDPSERAKLAENSKECKEFLDGLKAYEEGSLVRADPKVFWAPDGTVGGGETKFRQDIVNKVKGFFAPGEWPTRQEAFVPQLSNLPTYVKDDSGERLGFDVRIGTWARKDIPNPQTGEVVKDVEVQEYAVEAILYVENDTPGGKPSDLKWRVHSLELISGKSGGGPSLVGAGPGGGSMGGGRPR
jgi:hypothetical protein